MQCHKLLGYRMIAFIKKLFKRTALDEASNINDKIEEHHFDDYLDCKNMLCPKPIFEISKKMKRMETGLVLKVECKRSCF